jgi:hypothetical protein
MAASIFSGEFVKLLKSKLKLFNGVSIQTGTDDPSAVAKDGLKGSLYLRTQTGSTGIFHKTDDGSSTNWSPTLATDSNIRPTTIGGTIQGFGVALTPGEQDPPIYAPFSGTIVAYSLAADQVGSAQVDVWVDTTVPTVADSIVASAPLVLTAARNVYSTTLTGWTTAISAGDIIKFNLDSASTITALNIQLWIQR